MKKVKLFMVIIMLMGVSGCTRNSKKEDKPIIFSHKNTLPVVDGLIEITTPVNLIAGNTAQIYCDEFENSTVENTVKGEKTLKEQITSCEVNSDGTMKEMYTEKQLEEKKKNIMNLACKNTWMKILLLKE